MCAGTLMPSDAGISTSAGAIHGPLSHSVLAEVVSLFAVALVACAAPVQGGGKSTTGSDPPAPLVVPPSTSTLTTEVVPPCAGVDDCVDVSTLPLQWTGFDAIIARVDDIDGDHVADVLVESNGLTSFLTRGPYATSRSDLNDAFATTKRIVGPIGDVTSDGIVDFSSELPDWLEPDDVKYIIAGPIQGDIDAMPRWMDSPAYLADFTGDGVVDSVSTWSGSVTLSNPPWEEVRSGPASEWFADPILRIEVEVTDADLDECETLLGIEFAPQDLDGDGVPELLLNPTRNNPECAGRIGYVIPRDVSLVELSRATDPGLSRYIDGQLVPDQDGDGVADTVYYLDAGVPDA